MSGQERCPICGLDATEHPPRPTCTLCGAGLTNWHQLIRICAECRLIDRSSAGVDPASVTQGGSENTPEGQCTATTEFSGTKETIATARAVAVAARLKLLDGTHRGDAR